MTGALQHRLRVLIAAAAAALIGWIFIPGTGIDRFAFTTVVRGFANPPFFISGDGAHATPWRVRTITQGKLGKLEASQVLVSLGDDLDGFFQSSPPSPIDLAVILTNMQRLGGESAATSAVFAWDAPDPIGLMALDKAIGRFDSLIMAAPLSRGAVPESMPVAFRNASIPLGQIQGNLSLLPVVNRVPLPGIVLGKENTLAGFQTLDSEPDTGVTPLLARWEDRAVIGFPVLVALQQLGLPLDGMQVRLGEFIKLSAAGPVVPIDRYGRMAARLKPLTSPKKTPAEALIDGGNELIPDQAKGPMILLDDRSNAAPSTRAYSKILPAAVAAMVSDTVLAPARSYPRLATSREFLLLAILTFFLGTISSLAPFARRIAFLSVAAVCIAAQCIAAGAAELWLPGLPALAAILSAYLISFGIRHKPAVPGGAATAGAATAPQAPEPPLPVCSPPEDSAEPEKPVAIAPVPAKPRTRRKKRRR